MTDDKPSIHEALSAVMAAVRAVRKDSRNSDQGYVFRGIDAVVNAVGPALREHGVVPVPMLEDATYRDVQTSRGKPSREVTVRVRYRFYGPAGDYVDTVVPGEAMDFGDKGTAKAMSVAMRIALLQALALPTDEQDADASTYERATPGPRPPQSPADAARDEIAAYCREHGIDTKHVAADFEERVGTHITKADEGDLRNYLALLQSGVLDKPEDGAA